MPAWRKITDPSRRKLVAGLSATLALGASRIPASARTIAPAAPFNLTSHDGRQLRSDIDFAGRPMLVYFGFTFCPDVCPTSLVSLSAGLEQVSSQGRDIADLAFLFVSLDPDRDTPERLAEYVDLFHPALIGATGTRAQIDAVADAWKVKYALGAPSVDGDYLVDHPSYAFGLDRSHRIVDYLWHFAPPAKLADQIRKILSS